MPKPETRNPKRNKLTATLRTRLTQLAAEHGAAVAAALVGIHPQTYASLAAGFSAHRSTVALVERRLAELDAERSGPNRDGGGT